MLVKRDRNNEPGSAEEEALLQQTEGIGLTKQDVQVRNAFDPLKSLREVVLRHWQRLQEGYDTDLLDALPRGGDSSALTTSIPADSTTSSAFGSTSPAASSSLHLISSDTSHDPPVSDAVKLLPSEAAAALSPKRMPTKTVAPVIASPRNAAQVYAARARAAEFAGDVKRKDGTGPQAPRRLDDGAGGDDKDDAEIGTRWRKHSRRQFSLSQLERRVWIWLAIGVFACIAIGVGVGVGVGLGLKQGGSDDVEPGGNDQQAAPVRPTMMGGDVTMRIPPEVTVSVVPDVQPSVTSDDTYATPL